MSPNCCCCFSISFFFFFQAEDGIRDGTVTGVQTCALPIYRDIGDNDVRLETDQFRGQCGQAVAPAQLVPPVDDEVLSFEVAEVPKPLAKGLRRVRIGRIDAHQDTDARQLPRLLLGAGGKRCSKARRDERHKERHACELHTFTQSDGASPETCPESRSRHQYDPSSLTVASRLSLSPSTFPFTRCA